jgi:predicted ATP-grasp superfamily ATP-dependent carboligase/protein-tyrosine-phosphatase
MRTRGKVLVLGQDTLSFLAVIRSLGRFGLEVHVAWCPLDSPALASRYVNHIHHIAPYREESLEWLADFRRLLQQHRFDLVLPTTDDSLLPLQKHRAELEPLARLCLLRDYAYAVCSNKDATYELAVRLDVPLPRQRVAQSAREALEFAGEFGYPVVLKPKRSAVEKVPNVRQKVQKAWSREELVARGASMTADGEILLQQNVVGCGVGVEVLCKNGRVLTAFQHERVHEPMMGGGSSYRKSVRLDESMLSATRRLMEALEYTGVAMVEYKYNRENGNWVLIEINPRFWGSLPLSIAAGLDFPRYLYEMIVEGREEFPSRYRVNLFSRHWSSDMQWFLANLRADRSNPALQSKSLWAVLAELGNVVTLRERSDTFKLDDRAPAWLDVSHFLGEKAFKVVQRTRLHRRREERRLLSLYGRASRIIVLCYGNICRSPFAARLLEAGSGKAVSSAGTYPREGRGSPPSAIEAAREFGVDLARHRSTILSREEAAAAELILVFDRANWLSVRALCPEAMPRVAYLGAADPAGSLEIDDPFGQGVENFSACYGRIHGLIARLTSGAIPSLVQKRTPQQFVT